MARRPPDDRPFGRAPKYDVALFFGESHTDAVRRALATFGAPRHRALNIGHIEHPTTEEVFVHPLFSLTLEVPAGLTPLYISMLGGNAHNILGLISRGKPFDFILPEEPDLEQTDGCEPQTYAFVETTLRSLMSYSDRFLRRARSAIHGPMLQLESPPPVEDADIIHADLRPRMSSEAETFEISPSLLRYKLWRVHSKLMAEMCRHIEIEYVRAPEACFVDGRFLRPDLFQDATHANEHYGQLVLEQLRDRINF